MVSLSLFSFAVVCGAIGGSALTTLIERLPRGESPLRGRSRCPHCRRHPAARDLIPVVSFLLLQGRCRSCGRPIPRWHLAVEVGTIGLFVGAALRFPSSPIEMLLLLWGVLAILLALAVTDLQTMLLPDVLVGVLAGVGAVMSARAGSPGLQGSIAGGAVGVAALGLIAVVPWHVVRRRTMPHAPSPGPPAAMGFGDIKLAGALGVMLGPWALVTALFLAFVAGGLVGALLVLTRRASLSSRVPFGPFLAGAAATVLFIPALPTQFFRLLGI